jgi:hypothetical protein
MFTRRWVVGCPSRWWRSLRMRARSQRWAARTSGWRALALRQRRYCCSRSVPEPADPAAIERKHRDRHDRIEVIDHSPHRTTRPHGHAYDHKIVNGAWKLQLESLRRR